MSVEWYERRETVPEAWPKWLKFDADTQLCLAYQNNGVESVWTTTPEISLWKPISGEPEALIEIKEESWPRIYTDKCGAATVFKLRWFRDPQDIKPMVLFNRNHGMCWETADMFSREEWYRGDYLWQRISLDDAMRLLNAAGVEPPADRQAKCESVVEGYKKEIVRLRAELEALEKNGDLLRSLRDLKGTIETMLD